MPEDELYQVFNMGIGMVILAAADKADEIMRFPGRKSTSPGGLARWRRAGEWCGWFDRRWLLLVRLLGRGVGQLLQVLGLDDLDLGALLELVGGGHLDDVAGQRLRRGGGGAAGASIPVSSISKISVEPGSMFGPYPLSP